MDETRPTFQQSASLQPDPQSVPSLDHRTYTLSYRKQLICPRLCGAELLTRCHGSRYATGSWNRFEKIRASFEIFDIQSVQQSGTRSIDLD